MLILSLFLFVFERAYIMNRVLRLASSSSGLLLVGCSFKACLWSSSVVSAQSRRYVGDDGGRLIDQERELEQEMMKLSIYKPPEQENLSPEEWDALQLKRRRTQTFLQRLVTSKDPQMSMDMLMAALLVGSFREPHLEYLIQCAKPYWFRCSEEVLSGRRPSSTRAGTSNEADLQQPHPEDPPGLILSPEEIRRDYDVAGSVVRPWERTLELFYVILDNSSAAEVSESKTTPLSVGEEQYNRLLSFLLSHFPAALDENITTTGSTGGDESSSDPPPGEEDTAAATTTVMGSDERRKLSEACWSLCSKMELKGVDITSSKSLEVLGVLLDAYHSKAANEHSSPALYISRREFLEGQARKLEQRALGGGGGGGDARRKRAPPRPRTVLQEDYHQ